MKTLQRLTFILLLVFTACTKVGTSSSMDPSLSSDPADLSIKSDAGGSGVQPEAGVITAGEWNDLEHWDFWNNLLQKDTFGNMQDYWTFFTQNRIEVLVTDEDSLPVTDAVVQLKYNGNPVFNARTDNSGKAELWAGLFQKNANFDYSLFTLDVNNGTKIISSVQPYAKVNRIILPIEQPDDHVDIACVVDATGSMSDELEYLKTELLDVFSRAQHENENRQLSTAAVFYRDKGDNYLTRISSFSSDPRTTIDFIRDQHADGGGDYEEAVETALGKATDELQWSSRAKARLLFLILDAPPHYNSDVVRSLQTSILKAAAKGIKIIPITASGIDKQTEFLMRFLAMSTHGTYVFITNDSGIGNDHLTATVGPYEVEHLNNLMVRLINQYAK